MSTEPSSRRIEDDNSDSDDFFDPMGEENELDPIRDADREDTDREDADAEGAERSGTVRPRRGSVAPTQLLTDSESSQRESKFAPLDNGHLVAGRYEIDKDLGQGGFGAVYRAYDHDLKRFVAIKQSTGLRSFVAGQVRNEAKSVASLNHPNIVAIHDLMTISDSELLIIMECLEGMTLRQLLRSSRLTIGAAAKIAVQIADALRHAHERKLVHSDLKPSNLFVCRDDLVKLLDFGLAVAYFPDEAPYRIGGTAGYMSPEQIRGESHLIDGRVDIFAFGVVLYEMLTGEKPFVGSNSKAVYEATLRKEVPPPRQLNPDVDPELQRIVLKCLEKRRTDRYDSVAALQSDLAHWQQENSANAGTEISKSIHAPVDSQRGSDRSSIRLRSRGLQPYTEADSDVYLSLVPGPRNRDGVPDSIVFWKRWVESDDPNNDYPVGVLYGPSGAGKTSYIRGGLLNQLDRDVCKVYIECRPGDLGGRLTRIIQSRIHEESADSSLRDLLTRLRSGDSSSRGFRKLLIVLDQFEAWSHMATLDERQDFADALRQCDGVQIRALVVTRDDYWMGVRELLKWIELPLQEGRNVASVDLLDPAHARTILEAMGREAGTLPADGTPLSTSQQQFIRQAVDELSQDGYVVCVHLVMFAQMVRVQKWSPRGLSRGGGVVGACAFFFQELFQKSGNQSPEYRRVADAVAPILLRLIPEEDATVATVSVPYQDLAESARAEGCGHLFDDCLKILRDDLRIVTVVADDRPSITDDEAAVEAEHPDREARYRLSHDFLIEPINVWLDSVRSRTWRGRAKSRLMKLSDAWSRRPLPYHLPGFTDFLFLLAGSSFRRRSETESKYLRAAARAHAGRISVAVIGLIAFLTMSVIAYRQSQIADEAKEGEIAANVDLLFHGPAEDVPTQIEKLRGLGRDAEIQVAARRDSPHMQSKLRSRIYLQSLTSDSLAGIAPILDEATPDLFLPILKIAQQAADAKSELARIAADSSSVVRQTRAAILLLYLDDPSAIRPLLLGSEDAEIDQTVLMESATWRDDPQPWLLLLESETDPQILYHTMVVLGSFPRKQLEAANANFDFAALINSPHAAVHSAGRFLAHHLGQNVDDYELDPPDDAEWLKGPDNMPMIRVDPTVFEFEYVRNDEGVTKTIEFTEPFWVTSLPVSRRLFAEFAEKVESFPDDSPIPSLSVDSMNIPESMKEDSSQPMLKLRLTYACAFCNWLSEREGLQPCYRYEKPESPETHNERSGRLPPKVNWATIDSTDGYRLPTHSQYQYLVRSRYRQGTSWKHVKPLAEIGGTYAPPIGEEYARPLFSLMPNRLGVFMNDNQCGAWISENRLYTTARLGSFEIISGQARDGVMFSFGIYLTKNSMIK